MTVGDCWQGEGLGGALLDRLLARAAASGYDGAHADVLAENVSALALLRRRGLAPHP